MQPGIHLCLCLSFQRTISLVPGPSSSEICRGIVSVIIFFPGTAVPWHFVSFTSVPVVEVQCHSECPQWYVICVSGRESSSHAAPVISPGCHSPLVPPSDTVPSGELQNALTTVPSWGIHHPSWPLCVFAWRSLVGTTSWNWAQWHSVVSRFSCCSLVCSSRASTVISFLIFLASFAASRSAICTIISAEITLPPFSFLFWLLASSLVLALFWASSTASATLSVASLLRDCFLVSGPYFCDRFAFFGWVDFLLQTVLFAFVFCSASSGVAASHSSWAVFRFSQMLLAVVRWSPAASLIMQKALMWPTWAASLLTASAGAMPSAPHVGSHPGGWFWVLFQSCVSQLMPSSSHLCQILRSMASHSGAAC